MKIRTCVQLIAIALLFSGASPACAQKTGNTTIPDSVRVEADIPYADTDDPRQTLDLVLPTERGEKLPVIVYVHGGAWRGGHKRRGIPRIVPFVESGKYVAATVGYRLTRQAQWPAQIHDCKAAIRWIRKHAAEWGIDAERIGVWGPSAGGHLVAMLGTSGDVASMDGTLGSHPHISSRVDCVVDMFGPTDFLTMNRTAIAGASLDHDAPNSPESLLVGGPIQENKEAVRSANPITYATADDPPFLIVHGTADPLVAYNQSELLHDALKAVDVPTTLITVERGGHGVGFGDDVDSAVSRFFAHHLRNEPSQWKDETVPAVLGRR